MSKLLVVHQMPAFKKTYKKLHVRIKKQVDDAIKVIMKNPTIGDLKKGDLAGVYVYKFKIDHLEYLLAYTWNEHEGLLLALGVHENFYRNIKRV